MPTFIFMGPKFLIITPARDEEANIAETIANMASQTLRPARWIIVDDGSSDGTLEILTQAAAEHDWIECVSNEDRGFRAAGSGVVEAFYKGFDLVEDLEFDYIVKFDADLSFGRDYLERCHAKFELQPKLGIGGGMIYNMINGVRTLEEHPAFHVRGATKIYRRACWEDIGGLFKVPGWDTLDEVKAQMTGWETESFPDIAIDQLRMTGGAAGQWANWKKNGRASYIAGYDPFYLTARAIKKVVRSAELVAGFGLITGYLTAMAKRIPQVDDPELLAFLKKNQRNRLIGKSTIWR